MNTGVKLVIVVVVVAAVTGYMAYVGASTSWQYYLTVDECLDSAGSLQNSRLRVHGRVLPGSLEVTADRGQARFQLGGQAGMLNVCCAGPLPDNLKEEIDVVVEGRLGDARSLNGDRVLTQCASKYRSTESSENPKRIAGVDTEDAR